MGLRDALTAPSLLDGLAYAEFDRMFVKWNENKGTRGGIHASSVIADDFCLRAQILALHYKQALPKLAARTLRIFLHGWHVHIKYQTLFQEMGIADAIEAKNHSKSWGLHFTPDAVVRLVGKRFIVEIKSVNSHRWSQLTAPPSNAVAQAQLYMHLIAIPNALILAENKDTQDLKLWSIQYDPAYCREYIERLKKIKLCNDVYNADGRIPKRHHTCIAISDDHAQKCPLREVCFAAKAQREKMSLDKETS